MPLYEYKCQSCGKTFEVIQKFSDEPLKTHPECNGGPVEKILSAPAIQFKGSGWYVTDYGKGNGGAAGEKAAGEKKSESKSETKSESNKESKPAASTSESRPAPAASSKD
jgi:putative FmdB family regulatory protein